MVTKLYLSTKSEEEKDKISPQPPSLRLPIGIRRKVYLLKHFRRQLFGRVCFRGTKAQGNCRFRRFSQFTPAFQLAHFSIFENANFEKNLP